MFRNIVLGYAVFLTVGAFFGARAGSKVSLYMGIGSAVCILIGLLLLKSEPFAGLIFLSTITGILTITFFVRLLKTHALMPSGMLLAISAIVFIISLMQFKPHFK